MKSKNNIKNLNLNSLVGSIFNSLEVRSKNNRYFVYPKNGYHIIDTNFYETDCILYCKVFNKKIIGAIEVKEDTVLRTEKIIGLFGNYKTVKKHFNL